MNIDDTMPTPSDVERQFQCGGDEMGGIGWLKEQGIDPAPVVAHAGRVALVDYGFMWNAGRYEFVVYPADHVGPKRSALAVPVPEGGDFVDLLLIADDTSFETTCGRAAWLGSITPTTRLHAHPLDWLQAGCTGACHIAPISRKGLKHLGTATRIECDDIGTALEAWSWAFESSDVELSRFEVDDTSAAIQAYYEREIRWHAGRVATNLEERRSW